MTAHDWYRPPIPAPPTICANCGARADTERGYAPCTGEPLDTEPMSASDGAGIHRAAWRQHQEAHR